MNRYPLSFTLLVVCALLNGCFRSSSPLPPTTGDIYRPVHATSADVRNVQTLAPQPLKNAGKIYVKNDYLFINEVGYPLKTVRFTPITLLNG